MKNMSLLKVPDKPFAASFDEWDEWEARASREYPVRFFLSEKLPIWFARTWSFLIHDPWYWLKCRVWHRWNVVVCRDLPPTWNDRDDVLLHASFQILKDFVEKERYHHVFASRDELLAMYEPCGPKNAAERADAWIEVRTLYQWWESRRLETETPIDCDEELREYDRDNEMLKRLADVRGYLWT